MRQHLTSLHWNTSPIRQAECEAEAEVNGDEEESGGDNNRNQESESNRSSIVEIRADHIAKIAAELLLDLS